MPNSRVWCFTLNNPTDAEIEEIKAWESDPFITEAVVGQEGGGDHTMHLQGYFRTKDAITHVRAKNLSGKRSHVEVCRDVEASKRYCAKENNVILMKEKKSEQGKRTDIHRLVQALKEGGLQEAKEVCPEMLIKYPAGAKLFVSLQSPSPLRPNLLVEVYHGASGTGKSSVAHLWPDAWTLSLGMRGTLPWFDGYAGESTLILDEFNGQIPFRILLRILDIYPLAAQIKGGHVQAHWNHIIITSNSPWNSWYHEEQDITPLGRRIHRISDKFPFGYMGPVPEFLANLY